MRYIKRLGLISFALFLLLSGMVVSAEAQNRGRVVRRPIIVRHYGWRNPFWYSRGWMWNDPYYYDPYLREQRDRYYKEKAVKDASKKLDKDQAKYASDGVVTAKEREKLDKRQRDYSKAMDKLNKFNEDSD